LPLFKNGVQKLAESAKYEFGKQGTGAAVCSA
jgi:hypothetical protein